MDRRDVLKSIGAGGVSIIGATSMAAAEATDDHLERVLEDARVQSIRDAVGGFEVRDTSINLVETDELKVTGTWIETDLGLLTHGETEDGTTVAYLEFSDLARNPDLRQRLPPEYRNVPRETDVALYGHESSVSMVRSVTDQEQRQLKNVVPESNASFTVATYSSDIDGYTVTTEGSRYRVGENGRGISPEHVEKVAVIQGCLSPCLQCASWAAGKGICYLSCAAAKTVVGAVACVLCIAQTNMSLIWAGPGCADCYNNCT